MSRCLSPFLGMLLGFTTGWVIHMFLPTGSVWEDAATRLLMLLLGTYGWAISTIFGTNCQLYCGGTLELDDSARHRYGFWGLIVLFASFFLIVFLATGHLILYSADLGFLFAILIGEICWGRPKEIFIIMIGLK